MMPQKDGKGKFLKIAKKNSIAAREAARRMSCTNNLKQWALAAHNFHDTHDVFPPVGIGNHDSLTSWSILLLPFMELPAITEMIASGGISYRANVGDCSPGRNGDGDLTRWDKTRDIFQEFKARGLSVITDGTSNTMMFGESLVAPQNSSLVAAITIAGSANSTGKIGNTVNAMMSLLDPTNRKNIKTDVQSGLAASKGTRWNEGTMYCAGFVGVMPPNSVSGIGWVASDVARSSWMSICLSSNHVGGANAAFADGSVHFVQDSINNLSSSASGDIQPCITAPPELQGNAPSPFGVLGALSTAFCGKTAALP